MVDSGYLYKHYKGGIYQVICVGTHTETSEKMVAYRDGKDNFWIRPLEMFEETVIVDGKEIPRFTRIDE